VAFVACGVNPPGPEKTPLASFFQQFPFSSSISLVPQPPGLVPYEMQENRSRRERHLSQPLYQAGAELVSSNPTARRVWKRKFYKLAQNVFGLAEMPQSKALNPGIK
jgi:hypothetical protein